MRRLSLVTVAGVMFLVGSSAWAEDRTVTLEVENMTCATCPIIVRGALKGVEGVKPADVSMPQKTAVVTFDDATTNVAALTNATTNAGFPSRLKEE